jgi:hypothetical protein
MLPALGEETRHNRAKCASDREPVNPGTKHKREVLAISVGIRTPVDERRDMTDSEILFSDHKATSQSDVYSRTRTFSVDGQPFFAIEKRFKGDPRFDSRYTDEFAELMTVAFTLALLGHENVSIHRMDHHRAVDFVVTFETGNQAFIEISAVVRRSSAQYAAILAELNAKLNELVFTSPQISAALSDQFAEIILPTAILPNVPLEDLLNELKSVVLGGDLSSDPPTLAVLGPEHPLLHELGAQLFRGRRGTAGHIGVREPARAVGPYDLIGLTLQRLESKRRQAENQHVGRPRWLVLYFAEPLALYDTNLEMLSDLNSSITIAPFDRVLIGDQRRMIEFSAVQLT